MAIFARFLSIFFKKSDHLYLKRPRIAYLCEYITYSQFRLIGFFKARLSQEQLKAYLPSIINTINTVNIDDFIDGLSKLKQDELNLVFRTDKPAYLTKFLNLSELDRADRLEALLHPKIELILQAISVDRADQDELDIFLSVVNHNTSKQGAITKVVNCLTSPALLDAIKAAIDKKITKDELERIRSILFIASNAGDDIPYEVIAGLLNPNIRDYLQSSSQDVRQSLTRNLNKSIVNKTDSKEKALLSKDVLKAVDLGIITVEEFIKLDDNSAELMAYQGSEIKNIFAALDEKLITKNDFYSIKKAQAEKIRPAKLNEPVRCNLFKYYFSKDSINAMRFTKEFSDECRIDCTKLIAIGEKVIPAKEQNKAGFSMDITLGGLLRVLFSQGFLYALKAKKITIDEYVDKYNDNIDSWHNIKPISDFLKMPNIQWLFENNLIPPDFKLINMNDRLCNPYRCVLCNYLTDESVKAKLLADKGVDDGLTIAALLKYSESNTKLETIKLNYKIDAQATSDSGYAGLSFN